MKIGAMNLATKEFINLAETPDHFMNGDLYENAFSIEELAGQGFTIYPVRLPGCGHIFCYDCPRMYISHPKCPERDTKLGDPIQALAHVDKQIENCRRYLISTYNARLQSGLIRDYLTHGPQKQKGSTFISNDDFDYDATISDDVSSRQSMERLSGQVRREKLELVQMMLRRCRVLFPGSRVWSDSMEGY